MLSLTSCATPGHMPHLARPCAACTDMAVDCCQDVPHQCSWKAGSDFKCDIVARCFILTFHSIDVGRTSIQHFVVAHAA